MIPVEPRTSVAQIEGIEIVTSIWEPTRAGTGRNRDLLLVHGGAAHRRWWDVTAPLLARSRRVLAIDLSGHGDSGRRSEYTLRSWAGEVREVASQLCDEDPILVGHSMGGLVAVEAAQAQQSSLAGVITLDTPLRRHSPDQQAGRRRIAERPPRMHPTRHTALSSFRPNPPIRRAPSQVMEHVANTSFTMVDGGWVNKCDPRIYLRGQIPNDFLQPARVPVMWFRAEHGLIDSAMAARIGDRLGAAGEVLDVPDVGHHLLLEQPTATAWVVACAAQQVDTRAFAMGARLRDGLVGRTSEQQAELEC